MIMLYFPWVIISRINTCLVEFILETMCDSVSFSTPTETTREVRTYSDDIAHDHGQFIRTFGNVIVQGSILHHI